MYVNYNLMQSASDTFKQALGKNILKAFKNQKSAIQNFHVYVNEEVKEKNF